MVLVSQPLRGRDDAFASLDLAIGSLNLWKDICNVPPVQAVFGSVSILLSLVRDTMVNEQEYIDLGLFCAEICKVIDRGLDGRRLEELGQSALEAIRQLTTTVAKIQKRVTTHAKRKVLSRFFHAKRDKDSIASLKQDLGRILQLFHTELLLNTHMMLLDSRRTAAGHEGTDKEHLPSQPSPSQGDVSPDRRNRPSRPCPSLVSPAHEKYESDNAHARVEGARSLVAEESDVYSPVRMAIELLAGVLPRRCRLREATIEALCAFATSDNVGAMMETWVRMAMASQLLWDESDSSCGFTGKNACVTPVDLPLLVRGMSPSRFPYPYFLPLL